MKKTLLLAITLIVFVLSSNDIHAQVKLLFQVDGLKGSAPAYVTAFSEKDKKTQRIHKGKASLELILYNQYVVVVYQKGRRPHTISLDTEKASRQVNISIFLQDGKVSQKDYSPRVHYSNVGGRYSPRKFDLDEVRNKPAFASNMQEANEEVKRFLKSNVLPKIDKSKQGFQDDKTIRKTEHNVGQNIYKLLGKKRALELELERLNTDGFKEVYPDASMSTRVSACDHNLNILRREKQFYEVSYKLAKSELEKTEIMLNKKVKKGEIYTEKELKKSRDKVERTKREFDVADLNYKNKKTDCWELGLRADIDNTMDLAEKQLLEIEINNIRLYQRKQNAKRLYGIHNKLAMDVTERARLVELAKAQKFVSDHAKARVELTKNKIKTLRISDKGTSNYKSRIATTLRELEKNEELAFQAEMGYLEHMWNLRNKDGLDNDLIDDLYEKQNDVLEIEILPKRNRPEDFIEGFNPLSSVQEQAEIVFNSVIKITQKQDDRGEVQVVNFQDDFYEIVINSKGKKTYYKNGKPITGLTYRFETVKKYGEYLNNIRIEEEKRSKFLDFFRRKTDF